MAHVAVGFVVLGLLMSVLTWPVSAPLLAIPVLASVWIIRVRTVADRDGVTVRNLLDSRT
ncbi:MAG TPA: PH domain-containing protein, partial [Mycobacterium sp.]|nr:PH domain-containing protein [Mycobacterium sp.]